MSRHSPPDHEISVRLAKAKARDGTAIGQKTWTGALLLARALVAEVAVARSSDACANFCVEGKSCLELGCGTGLAGLTAIALGCKNCTFTDCSLPTLCDLRASVTLVPAARQVRAHIRRHVWESDCPDNIGKKVRHWSNADTCEDPAFRPASLSDHDVYDWYFCMFFCACLIGDAEIVSGLLLCVCLVVSLRQTFCTSRFRFSRLYTRFSAD
jgi:hypothetical protein